MSRPGHRAVPVITSLRVKNYRALNDLELKDLTPLTVFVGPNGSGKSTLFDVFAFLSECFTVGLRKAWDKRGRFKEPRVRSSLKRPRLSQALRRPTVKHSDKKANTSNSVDLPLPLGPTNTVRGVRSLSSRSLRAR